MKLLKLDINTYYFSRIFQLSTLIAVPPAGYQRCYLQRSILALIIPHHHHLRLSLVSLASSWTVHIYSHLLSKITDFSPLVRGQQISGDKYWSKRQCCKFPSVLVAWAFHSTDPQSLCHLHWFGNVAQGSGTSFSYTEGKTSPNWLRAVWQVEQGK